MLPQSLWVQWPPHATIGPQPLLQEVIHVLVHTPVHVELPQPTPQVTKQPFSQSLLHQPEQSESVWLLLLEHPLKQVVRHDVIIHDDDAQLVSQLEPHELEEI